MPAARPVIREFEIRDHPRAFALWQRCSGVGLSRADRVEAIAAYLARNPGTSFVAEADAGLAGTILCGHDGRRGLIHHLVTDTAWRRQGLARALLAHALTALRGQGIDKCHLMVFRDNAQGLAFWRSVAAVERVELTLWSLNT